MKWFRYLVAFCGVVLCVGTHAQSGLLSSLPEEAEAAFVAKQYAELEQMLLPRLTGGPYDAAIHRQTNRTLRRLALLKPATSERYDEWIATRPSTAAYLVRGRYYASRGWDARGDKFIHETHPDALARMQQIFAFAQADFRNALDVAGKDCDFCYAGMIEMRMASGPRSEGASLIDQALNDTRGGLGVALTYLSYLHPRWGGSWAEMGRFVDQFANSYPNHPALEVMRSSLLLEQSRHLSETHKPEQALVVAQQAATIDAVNWQAWLRVTEVAQTLDMGPLSHDAANRVLAIEPDQVYALTVAAAHLLQGSRPLDSMPFLERAVAGGSEWALKAILPIVASGRHGFKPDRDQAERICKSALDAQMPAGFTCMGGLNYAGIGRAPDKPRARQWFMEAADRGEPTAMVDAAIMLSRGEGGPALPEKAIELLLMAKKLEDPRADGHLRSLLPGWAYWYQVELPVLRHWANERLRDNRMHFRFFAFLLLYLLGALTWTFFHSAGDKPATHAGKLRLLRADWPLRLISIFNVVFALPLAMWAVFQVTPPQHAWVAWVLTAFILLAMGWLIDTVFLMRISFDAFELRYQSALFGVKAIALPLVADIGWSWVRQAHYLESNIGDRIHVPAGFAGFNELANAVEIANHRFMPTQME